MYFYFKNNKLLFLLTLFFSVVSAVASVLIALLLQKVLDIALEGETNKFIKTLIFSLAYFIVLGITIYVYSLFEKKLTCNILKIMRRTIFTGIIKQNIEDFNSVNTADYLSALNNDIKMIEENYIKPFLDTIQNIVSFVASLMLMLYFDPLVTLCVILSSILMLIIPSIFGKALQNRQEVFSKEMSEFVSKVKDFLSGFEIIKTYRMDNYIKTEFEQKNVDVTTAKYNADKLLAGNEGVSIVLALMVQVTAIFLSAYFIITGRITAGAMLGLIQVSSNLVSPILLVLQSLPKIEGSKPIVERINHFIIYQNTSFTGIKTPTLNKGITITNLNFSYKQNEVVLKNISLDFERNKKYAIIGKSGCGKTTLIRLLAGYYSNFEGKILYDEIELRDLDIDKLYEMSAIIHQNIYMFDDTIKDNICLHKQYSDKELQHALSISGVDMFLDSTKPLSTIVGENGSNLSGGQRQRIAVARAIIQKKPILIIDEGTSAIDMKTAYDIENRLLAMDELTLITITHSLNSELLKAYDKIVYLEQGAILEIGTFDELMKNCGPFAKYCDVMSN